MWQHPPRLDQPREKERFDPVAEGARYGLSREQLLAIWETACAEATDQSGRRDEVKARRLFHEIAARTAARRGRRRDVGRATRSDEQASGDQLQVWHDNASGVRAPGRDTRVEAETRRWTARNGHSETEASTTEDSATEAPATEPPTMEVRTTEARTADDHASQHQDGAVPIEAAITSGVAIPALDGAGGDRMYRLFGHDVARFAATISSDTPSATPLIARELGIDMAAKFVAVDALMKAPGPADGRRLEGKLDAKHNGGLDGKPDGELDEKLERKLDRKPGANPDGKPDGQLTLRRGQIVDGHGLGLVLEVAPVDPRHPDKLLVDPAAHLVDPKTPAELPPLPTTPDPTRSGLPQITDPKLKGLELKTKSNVHHDHDDDTQQATQSHYSGGGAGHAFARPPAPKPPEMDPKLLARNQTTLNAYIARCQAERAKAKDKVVQQRLAKTAAAQIDAKAIAARVKVANDAKLAKLRADARHDTVATTRAAQVEKQEGQVTLESLKARLEDKLTSDKQKFKDDFELKKQELTLRLQTQKETLAAESKAQVDNLKKQQKERIDDANRQWEDQKKGFEDQAKALMEQMRQQLAADKTKLADQQQQTMKLASDKAAGIEKDANSKADDLIKRGNTDAANAYQRGVAEGDRAYAQAQSQAAQVPDQGVKSQILAGGASRRRDFITKGELSSKDIKAKAADEAQKVRDTGQTEKKKVIDTADNQVKAIDQKINSLGDLAKKREAENAQALQAKLKAGQDALDKKIGDLQKTIDKKQKEADDKIKKLEDKATKQLQTDYDREVKVIDKKAETARKALATGSQKNIAQLEKLVDTTLSQIDKSVTETEKKFDTTILNTEKQAATRVMAALQSIKAEADKVLVAIDKEYDAQIKAVQEAAANTRKQIDETAQGKMLEIEVHVATMFSDLGDPARLDAVKKQLRWYVENHQTPPKGFGEVALPQSPASQDGKKEEVEKKKTPEQEAADKKKAEEAEAARRADLDPEERAKEDADKAKQAEAAKNVKPGDKLSNDAIDAQVAELLKKGQTATTVGAQASASATVKAAYDDGRHAINHVVNQKAAEIDAFAKGGTDAEVEQFKVDQKAGQDAADKIAKAANHQGFWGRDPDTKAILQALDGKTPAQIEALRAALLARTPPINIDDLINHTLSGEEQKEARIRMTGDPIAGDIQGLLGSAGWKPTGNEKVGAMAVGAVIAGPIGAIGAGMLMDAFSGSGVDRERIEQILARYKDPAERAKFAEAFERQTGISFNDFLKQNVPQDADKFKADKTPDAIKHEQEQADLFKKAQADAAAGKIDPKKVSESVNKLRDALNNFHFDGTRSDMVQEALDGKSPEEIALIMSEFKKMQKGADLETKLRSMLSGPALAQAEATVHNDPAQVAVSKLMGAEQSAWTPWTVDDKKLQDTLEGLTDPAQRRRVLAMYKAQTGVDLEDVIAHKMTGNDRRLAECLAKGDTLGAAEVKLEEAAHGGWLNGLQDAAAERFGIPKSITKGLTNVSLFGIGGAFLPSGTSATIDGYSIGDGGIHKIDSDQIFKVMESIKDPADRAKLAQLYKQATGKDLDVDMKATLGAGDPLSSGAKYDAFQALMEGDRDKAAACQARAALSDGLFSDKEAFYKQLEGKSEWERQRIMGSFNQQYGGGNPHAFQVFAALHLDGLDREKAELLANSKDDPETGVVKLPPEFELRYAMDSVWVKAAHFLDGVTKGADKFFADHPLLRVAAGVLTLGQSEILTGEAKAASWMMSNWGVDDQKVLEVLRENPELADTLDPKLKAEIRYTLSGRSGFEAQYYLDTGVPETPEEKIKFQLAMYQFDRGGSNWFSKGMTDAFSVSGQDYDEQYRHLLELQAQIEQCHKAGMPLPPELAAQANWAAGMSAGTGDQYEADKSKVANAAAMTVGVIVGAVVTVVTGGVGGAIIGALLAGAATIGTKAAILGNSYTRGEMGVDIVMTAVNAATAGVLKADPFKAFCEGLQFLSKGGQQLLNAVIGGAAASGVSSMAQTMLTSKDAHDLLSLIGQGVKAGLFAAVTGGANAAATHALNGLLDSLATKMFGTNATDDLGRAFRRPGLIEQMIKGYVAGGGGSIASMAVEAMADPAILRGSWDSVLANALQRFHEGGFQNALQVGAEHLYEARVAALERAVSAAKAAQAEGLSPEAQREAFAQTLAEAAQVEAAKQGKSLDGSPIAELPHELQPHVGDEPTVKGGHPDEPTVKGGHPDEPTAAGARGGNESTPGSGSSESEPSLTEVANKSHVVERANAALEAMPPEQRAVYERLLNQAENPAQEVMLERALAAGGSPEDLQRLAEYMKGLSEAEIARRFTGADALQFFQESCVPATLQAARAQVDPLYAFKLFMDPVFAAHEQLRALQETGGAAAERRPGGFDRKFDELVEQHPDLKAFLEDPTNFDSGTHGIEPALMKGNELLENLQHATGVQYDVVLREGMAWKTTGDGMFAENAVPHDRIQAALERGLPVPFSSNGHEQLITDCFTKDGKLYYVIHDPTSGSASSIPVEFMEFPMFKPASLMLPSEGPGGATLPEPTARGQVTDSSPTEAGGRASRGTGGDDSLAEQMAEGHSGIDLHTHFMGNVEPTRFRAVIEESRLARMEPPNPHGATPGERIGDITSWEPVLREIAALSDQGYGHTYVRDANGKIVIDPATGKGKIEVRGRTGDAIDQVETAQRAIDKLKAALQNPNLSPEEKQSIKKEIYAVARSACEKALRASDETDFNSSYEIRDELVKKFYGVRARETLLAAHQLPRDASIIDAEHAYREHFRDRPSVLDRIGEAVEAQRQLDSKTVTDPEAVEALKKKARMIDEQLAYDAYAKDTILRLAELGIRYSEQSNSSNKLDNRFDPRQIAELKKQLCIEHPELADQINALEIKHLTMININHFGVRDPAVDVSDIHPAATRRSSDESFRDEVARVVRQTEREDTVGVDIAGQEHFTLDPVGQERLAYLYDALLWTARNRTGPHAGDPIVLRPHVGEGANDVTPGRPFMRDGDRQIVEEELSHYRRARENLEAMITVFEGVAAEHPAFGGALPPDVIVRFGHATHTTPEQAARMARLGIIVEVNITSNVETGALSRQPAGNTRSPDQTFPRHEPDPERRAPGVVDDHALPALIANGVPVILSTDAPAVMSTDMPDQFRRAQQIIDRVKADDLQVPLTAAQAAQIGPPASTRTPPAAKYSELPEDIKRRFDDAYAKFYQDANDYYRNRPKPSP